MTDATNATAIFTLIDTRELVIVIPEACVKCDAFATEMADGGSVFCSDCGTRDDVFASYGNTFQIDAFVTDLAADLGVTDVGDIVQAPDDGLGVPAAA